LRARATANPWSANGPIKRLDDTHAPTRKKDRTRQDETKAKKKDKRRHLIQLEHPRVLSAEIELLLVDVDHGLTAAAAAATRGKEPVHKRAHVHTQARTHTHTHTQQEMIISSQE
jgi:hypothetical protein